MTITEKPLIELVQHLSPDLAIEVRHYIEFLLERQRKVLMLQTHSMAREWPVGFFDATAGSIPDFPDINRNGDGIDPSLDEIAIFDDHSEPRL
jgi:hypothetical protein